MRFSKKILAFLMMTCLFITGCNSSGNKQLTASDLANISSKTDESSANSEDVVLGNVLKFSDTYEKVKQLEGKEVKMTGYMSLMSPLDGSYIYLMNLPLQSCPFCLPDSTKITNTVACYAKEGSKIDYNSNPVVVTGVIELGNFKDDFGYEYAFKIKDVKIEEADTEKLAENYRIYSAVTEDGLLLQIYDALNWVTINGTYYDYGYAYEDIIKDLMDNRYVDESIAKLKGISETDYADLIAVCEKIKAYNDAINTCLLNNDIEGLMNNKLLEQLDDIWYSFNSWITKYEV